MKLLSSTKIALGFLLLVGLVIGGYRFYNIRAIADAKFSSVKPGKVNVVGLDPGAGYMVLVVNQMAQLVQGEGDFKSSDNGGEGPTEGAVKKRIPIREMLGAFNGDPKSIGEFVRIMNDIKQDENWPVNAVVWTSEDLERAFNGDKKLAAKLERDINLKLDGTPLSQVRSAALYNGILVDFPVSLTIKARDETREVVGRMQLPYRPKLLKAVEQDLAGKTVDLPMIAGTYAEAARKQLDDPSLRENVVASIQKLYSEQNLKSLRSAPERVLGSAEVIVNEQHVIGAESREQDAGDKKRYDIKVRLTDEGRRRLWKYSMDRVGSHVMLIVDGIAVAAPKISHELTQDELTIAGMTDPVLVREAVDALNRVASKQ
jgi:hypothetical protein